MDGAPARDAIVAKSYAGTQVGCTALERVMHVERSAMCMDGQRKRHPGGRRDPDPGEPPGFPRARE